MIRISGADRETRFAVPPVLQATNEVIRAYKAVKELDLS